jgi:hypothetical protein
MSPPPPPKRAREYIPLVDRFTCTETDKNKLKNIFACVDHIQNCLEVTRVANQQGVQSSLVSQNRT